MPNSHKTIKGELAEIAIESFKSQLIEEIEGQLKIIQSNIDLEGTSHQYWCARKGQVLRDLEIINNLKTK
jgi:hypothetical protein